MMADGGRHESLPYQIDTRKRHESRQTLQNVCMDRSVGGSMHGCGTYRDVCPAVMRGGMCGSVDDGCGPFVVEVGRLNFHATHASESKVRGPEYG